MKSGRSKTQGTRAITVKSAPPDRASSLILESELDTDSGIESTTLRDTRPIAAQKRSWDALRAMIASWHQPKQQLDEAA